MCILHPCLVMSTLLEITSSPSMNLCFARREDVRTGGLLAFRSCSCFFRFSALKADCSLLGRPFLSSLIGGPETGLLALLMMIISSENET